MQNVNTIKANSEEAAKKVGVCLSQGPSYKDVRTIQRGSAYKAVALEEPPAVVTVCVCV